MGKIIYNFSLQIVLHIFIYLLVYLFIHLLVWIWCPNVFQLPCHENYSFFELVF